MPAVTGGPADTSLLDAFRKQVRGLKASGTMPPEALLLIWAGEPGVSRDDLIDILKEEESGRVLPKGPQPGEVQRSPFM
jgi:hypothetical protein